MSNPSGRPKGKSKPRALGPLYLWRIEGGEVGSSAGQTTVFVVTTSATKVPDVHSAICVVSRGRYEFYEVNQIVLVGGLSPDDDAWLEAPGEPRTHPELDDWTEIADQSGYGLPSSDVRRLAVQILHEFEPVTPVAAQSAPMPAVATTLPDAYLARLHRNAPELLVIARTFASQLEDALRLVPHTPSVAGVACVHCQMKDDLDRILSVVGAIDGIDAAFVTEDPPLFDD